MPITRKQALSVYSISEERGTAVGLRVKGRDTLLIILIQQIGGATEEKTELQIKPETIYGEHLTQTCFDLGEVESICNLRVHFNDPLYVRLRHLRSNIRAIREEIGIERRISA